MSDKPEFKDGVLDCKNLEPLEILKWMQEEFAPRRELSSSDSLIELLLSWLEQRTILDTKDPLVSETLHEAVNRIAELEKCMETPRIEDLEKIDRLESALKRLAKGHELAPDKDAYAYQIELEERIAYAEEAINDSQS